MVAHKGRILSGKYQHENKGKDRPTRTPHAASLVASHSRLQIILLLNFSINQFVCWERTVSITILQKALKNSTEVKTFLKYWKIKIHINSMINNMTIIIANILPTFRLERFPCLVNIMLFSYLKYFLCLHCKNIFGFISLIWKIDSSAPFCADHRTKRGPTNTEEKIRMPSFNQHDRWREKIIAMEVRSNSQCKTISTDYARCCYFLILSGPLKYQWILNCETRVFWKTLRELCWTFFCNENMVNWVTAVTSVVLSSPQIS